MRLRSLLFVPGDRPDRFVKAAESGADAIILDLEDSVLPERKHVARQEVGNFLQGFRKCPALVRVNPVESPECDEDLAAIREFRPDGIVLPKAEGAESVLALIGKEGARGIPILPIATETPQAVFQLGSFRNVCAHLLGLTWGAEDLPAAIGASTARDEDGSYTDPYKMVRNLALFAAHAAGVPAIETVYPAIGDQDGLDRYARCGRRDGFTGMMAIHPSQVPVINEAFTPGQEELARARSIVAAFEAEPEAGAIQFEGRMLDRPHLLQARRLLFLSPQETDCE